MVTAWSVNNQFSEIIMVKVQEILGCIIEKLESKVQETGLPTADYAKIGNLM